MIAIGFNILVVLRYFVQPNQINLMRRKESSFSLPLLVLILLFSNHSVFAQQEILSNRQQFSPAITSSKFQVSVDGGLGYLLGSTKAAKKQMQSYGVSNQDVDSYYRQFKFGEQAGASAYYMIKPFLGIGLDYSLFTTKACVNSFIDAPDGWSKYYGPYREKIYTNFLGISCLSKQPINERLSYYGKLSAGLVFYRDEVFLIVSPALVTGNASAIRGELGFSYSIAKHVSLNVGISYLFSSLTKVTMNNGIATQDVTLEGDSKENLSRLAISTGLQFNF